MDRDDWTRRSLLQAVAAAFGVAAMPNAWAEVASAAHEAHAAALAPAAGGFAILNAADAADVEALTSQIVPSDETPGAREAGVVYFIDRGLATFFARFHASFLGGLREFQAACRERHPDVASFAALSSERQIEFLGTVDQTRFFDQARLLTLCALFSMPKYGGNRGGAGWQLLGFEDQHVFQPPFGYYDRDYPGFVVDPVKMA